MDSQQNPGLESPPKIPLTLAIPTVPCQKWNSSYDLEKALTVGTLFPDLDMPFHMGGNSLG